MKKTLTINLNGSVFHIDEDAFGRLSSYLNAIEKHFPNTEDKEILCDIEARIAELFNEKLINRNVVEIADVEDIIGVLGQPNQFGDEGETADEQPQSDSQESKKSVRKLYRDTDNQVLGGVLSGLAAYLGLDVVWLRILMVVLVIFGFGMPIPLYIIAWLIMPEAKTAAQKLEMRGEEVNIDSIKNFFESEQLRENASRFGSRISEIAPAFIKIIFIFVGIIAVIVGFTVICALLVAAVVLLFTGSWFVFQADTLITNSIFWSALAGVVLIPAIGMFVGGIRLIKNRHNPPNIKKNAGIFGAFMLAIWVVSLLVLIATAIHGGSNFRFSMNESREYVYENSTVPAFNNMDITDGLIIEIVQADTTYIENSNTKHIKTYVQDSVLYVKSQFNKKYFWNSGQQYDRKIIIHTPNVNKIKADNACKINSNTPLKTEDFVLDLENACQVNLDVEAKMIKIDCENACAFDMKTKAQNIRFDCENAVNAKFDVETDFMEISAGNANKIGLKGITNRLITKTGNVSSIDVGKLQVIQP